MLLDDIKRYEFKHIHEPLKQSVYGVYTTFVKRVAAGVVAARNISLATGLIGLIKRE